MKTIGNWKCKTSIWKNYTLYQFHWFAYVCKQISIWLEFSSRLNSDNINLNAFTVCMKADPVFVFHSFGDHFVKFLLCIHFSFIVDEFVVDLFHSAGGLWLSLVCLVEKEIWIALVIHTTDMCVVGWFVFSQSKMPHKVRAATERMRSL